MVTVASIRNKKAVLLLVLLVEIFGIGYKLRFLHYVCIYLFGSIHCLETTSATASASYLVLKSAYATDLSLDSYASLAGAS